MDRAHVAVKDDVGDPQPVDQPVQMRGPVRRRRVVADEVGGVRPEELVPGVEAHPPDLRPRRPQERAQPVEERPVRPLQQQEHARLGGLPGRARFRLPGPWRAIGRSGKAGAGVSGGQGNVPLV